LQNETLEEARLQQGAAEFCRTQQYIENEIVGEDDNLQASFFGEVGPAAGSFLEAKGVCWALHVW